MTGERMLMSLSYLEFTTRHRSEWRTFAEDMLGVPTSIDENNGALLLRMDARYQYSVSLVDGEEDEISCIGWDVKDAAALNNAAAVLESAGFSVTESSAEECAARQATRMISFRDPDGIRTELVYGRRWVDDPLLPTLPMDGIRSLGHLTLATDHLDQYLDLYQNVLGFQLSDYRSGKLYFLRCNPRHHSLALAQASRPGVHHFFLELESIDDVGRGFDRVRAAGCEIEAELGRHGNDRAISYYVKNPSGFSTECGWGGLEIDERDWVAHEFTRGDLWGHRRNPEEALKVAQLSSGGSEAAVGEVARTVP